MVINDAETTPLAPTSSCPPEFADATRSWNQGPGIRFFAQKFLQYCIRIVVEQGCNAPGENAGFTEFHNACFLQPDYTSLTYLCQYGNHPGSSR